MITYPSFDPVLLHLGPVAVRWYGLMYLLGFAIAWYLLRHLGRDRKPMWSGRQIEDVIFYGVMGVVIGGRLGYMLFYGWQELVANPINIIKIWEGGMSFHGGLIGVIVAMAWYGKVNQREFFEMTDLIVPAVPPGLGFGRLGNFINGELWGKPTDVPWGFMVNGEGRHASQLYEALLEGLLLFLILWWLSKSKPPRMALSGVFLLGYGIFRFMIEFVRVPDSHLGYLAGEWVTMGQLLSLPMILLGAWLVHAAYRPVRQKIRMHSVD
ncbi:MAG: prolipoprotein diacylglyceryl transferase [Gammaproteobacteria bacterium]|nr:prolipoprotein diacylglyceryl transferase [Gammaproteobacteria bacterium]